MTRVKTFHGSAGQDVLRRPANSSVVVVLLTFLTTGLSWSADPSAFPKLHLELILSNHLTQGANSDETAAAAGFWIKAVGTSQRIDVDTKTQVTGSVETMRKRVDEKSADFLVMSALDYLNIDRPGLLEPVVTISASENPKGKLKYLLLTNRDSGWASVESLKDKTVLTFTHSDQALLSMWTEVLLGTHHLQPADSYFHSISRTLKPMTACLPVYFGKAEACVIDDATWNTLKELNPQLGTKLRAIAESPYLLETIIALHNSRQQYRAEILKGMLTLPDSAAGRQVLLFLKARHACSISKDDFSEVLELRTAYQKIASAGEKKPAHSQLTAGAAVGDTQKDH